MPLQDSPKRSDYKTRKEYRFAHKKVKRNNMKQPEVFIPAIVLAIVITFTQNAGLAIILAFLSWIWAYKVVRPAIENNKDKPKTT